MDCYCLLVLVLILVEVVLHGVRTVDGAEPEVLHPVELYSLVHRVLVFVFDSVLRFHSLGGPGVYLQEGRVHTRVPIDIGLHVLGDSLRGWTVQDGVAGVHLHDWRVLDEAVGLSSLEEVLLVHLSGHGHHISTSKSGQVAGLLPGLDGETIEVLDLYLGLGCWFLGGLGRSEDQDGRFCLGLSYLYFFWRDHWTPSRHALQRKELYRI